MTSPWANLAFLEELPVSPAEPRHFTGEVWVAAVLASGSPEGMRLHRVDFLPRARTLWHTHPFDQRLVVLAGRCVVKIENEPARILETGDVLAIPEGRLHWHGATATEAASHLAINFGGGRTDWREAVEDADYAEAVSAPLRV